MSHLSRAARWFVCVAVTAVAAPQAAAAQPPFDFDSGNGAIEVVIPNAIPVIYQVTSPNDAPIVLRTTTIITNAWFDAIAPYHPTAVGVYSNLGRRPASERATNRERNIALIHASYRVMQSMYPGFNANWRTMMTSVGLDPDDASEDLTTPVGIGNRAGRLVAAAREQDGMNQLGDRNGRQFNLRPFEDYTGYAPVNTPDTLRFPGRWQPEVTTRGNGTFASQMAAVPQWALTDAYSFPNVNVFHTPPPVDSNPARRRQYKAQADEVLATSANLTDYQKMVAELFDNKIESLGFSALFIAITRNMGLDEFVHYDFLVNLAAFDGGIATWKEKYKWDAVRPSSAIRYLYGNRPVTAWGGPGQGTVTMPATDWMSYLNTANHPEYPSGSSCFCASHAQASRRYLGSDAFGWFVVRPAGSSVVEPGVTPAAEITLGPWDTFTEFETE
ncbi:MAG: vanadium-dependent haloperoxidase, partial [Vicinamibacteria bacterium]